MGSLAVERLHEGAGIDMDRGSPLSVIHTGTDRLLCLPRRRILIPAPDLRPRVQYNDLVSILVHSHTVRRVGYGRPSALNLGTLFDVLNAPA